MAARGRTRIATQMALDTWLVSVMASLLTAALSEPLTPTQPGGTNSSLFLSQRPDSGDGAPASSLAPEQRLGVRLVAGRDRCSGSVQVWRSRSWAPVCAATWTRGAAEAVCRVLGCGAPGPLDPPGPEPPPGNTSGTLNATQRAPNATQRAPNATQGTLAPTVRCRSDEWRLCEVVEQPCVGDGGPARVTCPEDRALRLVAGGSPCAGRVELLERGEWGSVCDDAWDVQDGHVVCAQLGCGWAVRVLPGSHFPPGQGPVHRDQVDCSGSEAFLWDCPGRPGTGYCGHKEDAGVVCSEHQSWRLTRGVDPCEGQVEVHYRGVWNTVCDSEWYQEEAGVLCRTLGCGSAVSVPRGWPHSLPGRMYYSCQGTEAALHLCTWRYNNTYLCRQSRAARVLCSGSRALLNLSTSEALTSAPPVTEEPAVMAGMEAWDLGELGLLVACVVLGALLLCALGVIAGLLLRGHGKYALPVTASHQQPPVSAQAGTNSYSEAPSATPKEAPPPPADSGSDSDYEHYDFSSQPPVALSTFYNSQRYHVTEEQARQNRFQMPPLEEDTPSLGPGRPTRVDSTSSTSSGEGYCNSPGGRHPPWSAPTDRNPLLEQPPSLELAGSHGTFSGPSADDSSSTSSGEWYQNYKPPPPPDHFACPDIIPGHAPGPTCSAGDPGGPDHLPGAPSPQPESTDNDDYDDIGTA